jgi:hypothetical protein
MSDDSETAAVLRRKVSSAEDRSFAASMLAKRRHQLTAPRTRRRACARAAKAFWDRLSPEDRVIEMRRRRKLGYIRKKKAALGLP